MTISESFRYEPSWGLPCLVRDKTYAAGPLVTVGNRLVGEGQPCYIVAEIGINHNGSLNCAQRLVEGAKRAGCDAVKFQKRTPERCVPADQWSVMRDTPWGRMSYIDYKRRVEFGLEEYRIIDRMCRDLGIAWFASCWDLESIEFIERFAPPCYKVASASITDGELLSAMKATGRPLMLSTGMSTAEEIASAVAAVGTRDLMIAHATSTYPCPPEELNLRMIGTLRRQYPDCPIGYSGHELGLTPTFAAVALGATFVERHITLDRTMWGTDQAASLDLRQLEQLVRTVREIAPILGDGVKRVYESEIASRRKLRRVCSSSG